MGNANMKPGIPDMLEFIKREINKWSTILVNIQRQQRGDVPWGDYIYNEFKETEEKWRRLRIQEYGNQRAGKNEGGVYEDGRKRREEDMRRFVNKINQLSSEKERIFQRNVCLERRFADMSKKISELQRENNELKSKPETFAVPNSISASKFQGNLREADQKIVQLQKQIAEKEDEMQTLKANVESLEMHVKFVEEEKANLLLRLSKMSGDRLIDNNPAIADLSDPNRPTKLGEVYSELYDNEWTNAFEKLHNSGYEEDTVVETLQLTLQNVFKFCEMKAGMVLKKSTDAVNLLFEEYKRSVSALVPDHLTVLHKSQIKKGSVIAEEIKLQQRWKPKSLQSNTEESESKQMLMSTGMGEKKERLKKTAEGKLIKLRKEVAVSMVPIVQEAYMEASSDPECLEELKTFILKCLYLGWMMVVQSPPMVLATCEAEEKFDKNKFKEYTKSGDVVDFLVWPALLLEKDGPVVVKGVAETKGK